MEEIRLYTIADLKGWILQGKKVEGLSEKVITTTRAFAFINNPYVMDDLPVVSALFVGDRLAAYTAAFPERLIHPDCTTHWFNSLYVSPEHEGKGYGAVVIGSLLECYGNDPIFDLDAVPASVEILSFLGLQSGNFCQYSFRNKYLDQRSLKGKIATIYDKCKRYLTTHSTVKALERKIVASPYTVQYDNFIDHTTFNFIEKHSHGDAFLRSMDSFNWMLRFPFVHETPLEKRVNPDILFSSSKPWQRYYVAKVFVQDEMAGVYILSNSSTQLALLNLYYEKRWEEEVLLSIAEHILNFQNARFSTTHPAVANFIRKKKLYPVNRTIHTSLCFTPTYNGVSCGNIQGGDGDMFLN